MNWEDLKHFIAVAEAGSLSGGARKTGVSAATIGRKIGQLERDLGVSLLRRSAGGITLSRAGSKIFNSAQKSAEALYEIQRIAAATRASGDLPVRISATEPIVSEILAPALPLLWQQLPPAKVSLIASTAVASFTRQEADIAVRMFRPAGDNLIARRLVNIELGCFAATAYLDRRRPEKIDIGREKLLVFDDSYGEIAEVKWVRDRGLQGAVALSSTSSRTLMQAARAGAGIAIAPRFLAARMGLVEVPAPRIPTRQCWLVSHADSKSSQTIMQTKEWVVAAMRAAVS